MLIKKNRIPIKQLIIIGFLPSILKKLYYKLKGYKIGKKVTIGFGSVILGNEVSIEDNTKIGFLTIIRAAKIRIGRFVKIGSAVFIDTEKIDIDDDARINEQVVIGGLKDSESYIKLGKRTIVMEMSFLNPTKPLVIGDDTGIGGHCLLFTHGSWLSQLEGYPVTFAPITLGKNVWLPWRVFILPGVNVGDNVVIGANSLVTKSLPSNCLAAGSPAKIIKESFPPSLSEEKRSAIINDIFENFIKYLNYNNFNVFKNPLEKGFELIIKNKRKEHYLIYLIEQYNNEINTSKDNILVLDYLEKEDLKKLNKAYKMKVNLRTKTRIGSSAVGEEFVSYLSRYGVRFNRLD